MKGWHTGGDVRSTHVGDCYVAKWATRTPSTDKGAGNWLCVRVHLWSKHCLTASGVWGDLTLQRLPYTENFKVAKFDV